MRAFLVPATAAAGQWREVTFRKLPPAIRQFGYVPDTQSMKPGDVLLLRGPNWTSSLIARAQERGWFDADHARWTHAGVYIGRDLIVEATPFGGVRVAQIEKATFRRELLVRRLAGPCLPPSAGYEIAVATLTQLLRGYSIGARPGLAMEALRRTPWDGRTRPALKAVTICSTVVREAYIVSVQRDLLPGVIGAAWPADLSLSPELRDISIGWAKAVP